MHSLQNIWMEDNKNNFVTSIQYSTDNLNVEEQSIE